MNLLKNVLKSFNFVSCSHTILRGLKIYENAHGQHYDPEIVMWYDRVKRHSGLETAVMDMVPERSDRCGDGQNALKTLWTQPIEYFRQAVSRVRKRPPTWSNSPNALKEGSFKMYLNCYSYGVFFIKVQIKEGKTSQRLVIFGFS